MRKIESIKNCRLRDSKKVIIYLFANYRVIVLLFHCLCQITFSERSGCCSVSLQNKNKLNVKLQINDLSRK